MFGSQPLRAFALLFSALLALPAPALAQQGRARKATSRPKAEKRETPKRTTISIPDLLTGQKIVEAAMDFNTYKVPLASGGVVMVEFPARDSILRAHPGDQNLVTVDDTDTAPNYPLIFRPGSGFVVGKSGPRAFAIITVQMASGIPFVFQVYPVANVSDTATHIVVRYDRDKVVAARRAAGLPVNYKPVPLRPGVYSPEDAVEVAANMPPSTPPQLTPTPTPSVTPAREETQAVTAPPVASPTPLPSPAPAVVQTRPAVLTSGGSNGGEVPRPLPSSSSSGARNLPASATAPVASRPAPTPSPAAGVPRHGGDVGRDVSPSRSTAVRPAGVGRVADSLRDYMKSVVSDSKAFSKFSKPLYGLSVAVSRPNDLNLETRMIVVAVKNTLSESVRLVAGQPDLFIETLDEKKRPVLVEPIEKLGLETTAPLGDMLAPGATAYYAVAFTPPILGTHQYLRISVAQTTAADAPASVDLTIKSR